MSSESSSSLMEKEIRCRPRRKVPTSKSGTRTLKQQNVLERLQGGNKNSEEEEDESDECTESDLCRSSTSEDSSDGENNSVVYMDYNATTPLDREVLTAIHQALKSAWGNPSSSHQAGMEAKSVIIGARQSVAAMIGAVPEDIIFTSGGTESNNMVLYTVVENFHGTKNATSHEMVADHVKPHIVTTSLEHDSIKLVLEKYQQQGKAEVTFVDAIKGSGCICPDDVVAALKPSTCLVTVMLANNETGIMQPLSKIAARVRQFCSESGHRPIFIHTDAAQAIGKIAVNVEDLGVDYLTIVGHKFYGPRIGALYVRHPGQQTPLSAMFYGGGQERNYRPGTENTGMIAGLGKACELIKRNVDRYHRHMSTVRDYLEKRLEMTFPCGVCFNGKKDNIERLPNTSNVSFLGKNLQGYRVLSNAKRLQASLGAACHSEMAHRVSCILLASGVAEEVAANAVRISVGRHTTIRDVDTVVADLKRSVDLLLAENQSVDIANLV